MTDRELLELAAKAAGYDVRSDGEGGLTITVKRGLCRGWNPLTDDGDALRLAVKLKINVSHEEIGMKSFVYAMVVFNDDRHIGLSEIFDDEGDRLERTRHAITRAAAQIGKDMQ